MGASDRLSEIVDELEHLAHEDLVTICKTVLNGKEEAIREIVDWAVPDIIFGPAKAITEARHIGVIKSYNDAKGFGFITSPEILQNFGKDIFLSSHQMLHFPVGAEVSFAILLNKGKHQAFDLALTNEKRGTAARKGIGELDAKGRTERADEMAKGKGGGWSMPEHDGFMMKGCPDGKGWAPWGMGWYPAQAWPGFEGKGWYDCQGGFAGDAFGGKGAGALGRPTAGKGRPSSRAKDASVGHHVPGLSDRRFRGRVKSYGKKYGYGFIISDELKDRFDKDIFAHAHELERLTKELEETIGKDVTFSVLLTEEDKPIAIDIEYDTAGPRKRSRIER